MPKNVNLGGDRLGSGNKMNVHLHGYGRSNHDLSYVFRSTMSAGTLVPYLCMIALPGDTFDIELDCDVKTHPTVAPLFGSSKVQLDLFQAPMRLYQALLHNNALNIGRKMSNVKLPQLRLKADELPEDIKAETVDAAQVNPSCIMAYLGIRGVGVVPDGSGPQTRDFLAIPYLAYWDIYKNYYANKQEEIGAVLHTPRPNVVETVDELQINGQNITIDPGINWAPVGVGTQIDINYTGADPNPATIYVNTLEWGYIGLMQLTSKWPGGFGTLSGVIDNATYGNFTITSFRYQNNADPYNGMPQVQTFPLVEIDNMRNNLLGYHNTVAPYVINDANLAPYNFLLGNNDTLGQNLMSSQEGLGLKTYQSDLYNNWLATEWIDGPNGVNEITAISTEGGSFTLDTLNLSKKIYDLLNRIAVSGGTYNDWLGAAYDHDVKWQAESPIYHGGLIKELVFQEVVSNAASDQGQPLGSLAGKGVMSQKHKGGKAIIRVDEPSVILGIVSITPRIDYYQGNEWYTRLYTMDDLHKPALDEIGFQDLVEEDMAWWSTRWNGAQGIWQKFAVGKQPAWINYMTNVNKVFGNFALPEEQFMVQTRRYEWGESDGIKDLTTYIDPAKFNFIFADEARDAQNYWTQIRVGINARRKMSARLMPNL